MSSTDTPTSKKNLQRQTKERENAARIAAKKRETLEKNRLKDPSYLTAKAKQQRSDDMNRIYAISEKYNKFRKPIPKLDIKFILNCSDKYKYPLFYQLLISFNDIVNRLNISYVNSYAESRINLFLKNIKDPQILLLPPSNPLYKVGLVNLLVRIKKNIINFTDKQVQDNTLDLPVADMNCLRELIKSYIWNLKINECDNFTLLSKEDQEDKFNTSLFRICKIVNNPIPNLQAEEEKKQNDANTQINQEAIRAQADAKNDIPQKSFVGGGDNFDNSQSGLNLDPDFLRVSGIFRNHTLMMKSAITDENIQVIINYAENKKLPLNAYALKILNDDLNKFKIGVWIGYITPKLINFLNARQLLPAKDDPLYNVSILNNALKIKKGFQPYKKSEVVRGSDNTILDYDSLQQMCIGYINDIKINSCAMYNLKGIDQQKDLYTNELSRICNIVNVPIKSFDLASRNLNIIDVLKKKINSSKIVPVTVKAEGFTNIKFSDYSIKIDIEYIKNYILILLVILIIFYLCTL
jgi:hypothetical protein